MAISKEEYLKEEKILSRVKKLLSETLKDLGKDVYQDEEDFTEFKKMLWENASSFDKGEMNQVQNFCTIFSMEHFRNNVNVKKCRTNRKQH